MIQRPSTDLNPSVEGRPNYAYELSFRLEVTLGVSVRPLALSLRVGGNVEGLHGGRPMYGTLDLSLWTTSKVKQPSPSV